MTAKLRLIVLLAMVSVIVISCSKDKLDDGAVVCEEPIVYDDVRSIISQSCGYVGCHNGINLDNLNSFAGLENSLNSGSFTQRVIDTDNMPPANATGPTSLTLEQLDLLRCWQQNGFSEF